LNYGQAPDNTEETIDYASLSDQGGYGKSCNDSLGKVEWFPQDGPEKETRQVSHKKGEKYS
jgi:hypothetical protein